MLTDSVEINNVSANKESLWTLVRKLVCEVNGEALKDMLIGVSSPVRRTEWYKELIQLIQPGNVVNP